MHILTPFINFYFHLLNWSIVTKYVLEKKIRIFLKFFLLEKGSHLSIRKPYKALETLPARLAS